MSTARSAIEDGVALGVRNSAVIDASAIGAHGVMDWQPSGAQGKSHGAWCCPDSPPDSFWVMPAMFIPGIFIPGMSPLTSGAAVAAPSVMSHAKPFPTHARWVSRMVMTSAVN